MRSVRSLYQSNLDVNVVRDLYSHYSPHDSFVRIDVYKAFVDTHLEVVPSMSSFTAGRLSSGHYKVLCRKRYGASDLSSGFAGDVFEFAADGV